MKARAYYLANREKYLQRSREYHATYRQEALDYQSRYYQTVTKNVRHGYEATTPIRGAKSQRKRDKVTAANPRAFYWTEGVPTIKEGITVDWAS